MIELKNKKGRKQVLRWFEKEMHKTHNMHTLAFAPAHKHKRTLIYVYLDMYVCIYHFLSRGVRQSRGKIHKMSLRLSA